MSFILDALKKSEQERKRDQVPDLQSIQVAVRPFRRSSLAKIVLLSVWAAITLVLMALWLQQKFRVTLVVADPMDAAPLTAVNVTQGDSYKNQAQSMHDQNLVPEVRDRQTPPDPITPNQSNRLPSTMEQPIDDAVIVDEELSINDELPVEAVQQVKEVVMPIAEPAIADAELPENAEIIRPRQVRSPQSKLRSPPRPDIAPASDATEEDFQHLPELNQMPQSFVASLPKLDFISHLYSSDPASRSVIINGKTWRERQRISSELQLLAIIPEGVVLSYQGKQFRMPVIQNWSGPSLANPPQL
jgi:general secretion pathway protein B